MTSDVSHEKERWEDADELRWAARTWAARVGVTVARISVRPMRRKWASMSTAGRLTLGTDLLEIPKPLGEYVIVHELVHRLVPNHGKVFKTFMHTYLPDWERRHTALSHTAPADRGSVPESSEDPRRID